MADYFYIKRDDTRPSITGYCRDARGNPVNLSGASVKFNMRLPSSNTSKVNSAATVVNASIGQVRYDWSASDTDTAGDYNGEFQVTFSDGKIETYPNSYDIIIKISEDNGD